MMAASVAQHVYPAILSMIQGTVFLVRLIVIHAFGITKTKIQNAVIAKLIIYCFQNRIDVYHVRGHVLHVQ